MYLDDFALFQWRLRGRHLIVQLLLVQSGTWTCAAVTVWADSFKSKEGHTFRVLAVLYAWPHLQTYAVKMSGDNERNYKTTYVFHRYACAYVTVAVWVIILKSKDYTYYTLRSSERVHSLPHISHTCSVKNWVIIKQLQKHSLLSLVWVFWWRCNSEIDFKLWPKVRAYPAVGFICKGLLTTWPITGILWI